MGAKFKKVRHFKTFPRESSHLDQPMFLGNDVSIARYDQQKHKIFHQLTETHLAFFWRPQEINLQKDWVDFNAMSPALRKIFIDNIKYQIVLDSVQGRAPNVALLPITSLPELEAWIVTWSFYETIHSNSYTHIIRSITSNPHEIFDDIQLHPEIMKRAESVTAYYDRLIFIQQCYQSSGEGARQFKGKSIEVNLSSLKKALVLTLHAINALESIRFHVSFACNFAFAEAGMMIGCAKIMKLIARDEALHATSTSQMLNIIMRGGDGDSELTQIAHDCLPEAKEIFMSCIRQEKEWARYILKDASIPGLNKEQLCDYIDYLAYRNMAQVGLTYDVKKTSHCIPWIENYLSSNKVQNAPQESEVTSYLSGQVNTDICNEDLSAISL